MIQGTISRAWIEQFDHFSATSMETGQTLLRGTLADQAELHLLLRRFRDLGIPLVSITLQAQERAEED